MIRDDHAALERIAREGAQANGQVRQAVLPNALGLAKSSVSELVARLERHRVLSVVRESARGGWELGLWPDAEIAFGLTPHTAIQVNGERS